MSVGVGGWCQLESDKVSYSLFLLSVKTTILNYQSPTTGLFPVKTCSTCKEARVRDSLYCAAAAWALALAYRLVHNSKHTVHRAVKCFPLTVYCAHSRVQVVFPPSQLNESHKVPAANRLTGVFIHHYVQNSCTALFPALSPTFGFHFALLSL